MLAVLQYTPALLQGLGVTVMVALASILGGAVVALVLGLLRVSRHAWIRIAAMVLVEFFRGASALVFLFWVYYALPLVPGLPRFSSPWTAAITVLALVGGAYGAEIVRGAIIAVPRSQWDASHALGLSRTQALLRVVLPQAMTQIVPSFGSLAIDMIKWTSIVSFVGVQDLLYVANSIRTMTYQTVAVFTLLAATYWVLCLAASWLFRWIEAALPMNRALRQSAQARAGAATDARAAVPNS
jgi:ectoine/hydroxyectoine ABC transporter permease protein EhuC